MSAKVTTALVFILTLSGCQTVSNVTTPSPLQLAEDISQSSLPSTVSPIESMAPTESELENLRLPKQSNLRFQSVFAGDFAGGAEFMSTSSPLEYIDYLWGHEKKDPVRGLEIAKKLKWKDEVKFYTLNGRKAMELKPKLTNPDAMCLHAAHTVVAKFNDDSFDDALIACHGYDARPYPGDHSYLMLSSESGSYTLQRLTENAGFYHGATTMDLNSDGLNDIVLTDAANGDVLAYTNLGDGSFSKSRILLSSLRQNYVVFAADLNNDRHADLIVAGHEEERQKYDYMPSTVFWNDGSGNFSIGKKTTIPPLPGYGIVLDFIYEAPYLFVIRTQSLQNAYQGGAVQQIDMRSFSQVDLLKRPAIRHPAKLQRVYSPTGKIVFGSLDCDRNGMDFMLSSSGKINLVRTIEMERTASGCISKTP